MSFWAQRFQIVGSTHSRRWRFSCVEVVSLHVLTLPHSLPNTSLLDKAILSPIWINSNACFFSVSLHQFIHNYMLSLIIDFPLSFAFTTTVLSKLAIIIIDLCSLPPLTTLWYYILILCYTQNKIITVLTVDFIYRYSINTSQTLLRSLTLISAKLLL